MQVLVAPDSFGGSLTALQAAAAITDGWLKGAPEDDIEQVALSDGGPGFLDALAPSTGGSLAAVAARDPWLRPVSAHILIEGTTAYVESAESCGLHLVAKAERRPGLQSSAGVADLLSAALSFGPERIVVGLGGSATNDGGAGLLDEFGISFRDRAGGRLAPVPARLGALDHVELRHGWRPGVELVAATDVDNPLLGREGATAVYGVQKGVTPDEFGVFEASLARLADVVGRQVPGATALADRPGAGAAGGLGYGLFVLGASRESGIGLVLDKTRLAEKVSRADLVVTGEGSFDAQTRRGKVVAGVAAIARAAGKPCLVLAGRVAESAGPDDLGGISAVFSVSQLAGSESASLAEPAVHLASLAEQVSRARPCRGRPSWQAAGRR